MPRSTISCAGSFVMSSPSKSICPREGRSMPERTFTSVDLPAPFAPTTDIDLTGGDVERNVAQDSDAAVAG